MRLLRSIIRLVLLFGGMTCIHVAYVTRRTFLHETSARSEWRRVCLRVHARHIQRVCNMEVQVSGPLPEPPFLLVCNHLSYIDIVVLASIIDARFIAKRDVATWPWFGPIISSLDTIFVDRQSPRDLSRVNELIGQALDAGDGVALFPEGTSSAGEDVLPFRPSLLATAAQRSLGTHYAAITYSTPPGEPPAHQSVCWWGDMNFFDHFSKLLAIPKFYARVNFGSATISDADRKVLAVRLRDAVAQAFTPVVEKERN